MAESRKKRKSTKKKKAIPIVEVVEVVEIPKTTKELINERLILVFGEDNVDIRASGGVIIRFPALTIVNSEGLQHDITDLFIKLDWEYSNNEVVDFGNRINGLRTSYSDEDIYSCYSHSHLRKLRFGNAANNYGGDRTGSPTIKDDTVLVEWVAFCLGSDSLSETLAGLHMGFNIDKFYILLNTIDEFVRWESLAGGPHIRISTIKRVDNNYHEILEESSVSFNEQIVSNIFHKEIIKLVNLEDLDYFIDSHSLTFIDEEKAKLTFEKTLVTANSSNPLFLIGIPMTIRYKDAYYLKHVGTTDIGDIVENVNFQGNIIFKGETIFPSITKTSTDRDKLSLEIEKDGELVPHPYVLVCIMDIFRKELFNNLNKQEQWELIK